MRHLWAFLLVALLCLPAFAGEPPEAEPPAAPDHGAAVAEKIRGLEDVDYEEVWDRGDALRRLGPEAAGAMERALPGASPRARLLLARHLVDVKGFERIGAETLLALAAGAADARLRTYAANSLGQARGVFGSPWLLEGLDKAAETEKDKLVLVALHRARGRLGADDAAADSLSVIMKNNRGAVRKEAALALGEIGRASLPEVREQLLLIFRNDPTDRAERALSIYRRMLSDNPLLSETLQVITRYYDAKGDDDKSIDQENLVRAAVRGMVASLDPFSSYMDPEESQQLQETLTGEYGGIGAYVNLVDGVFTIISPIYGGPAHKAGLRSMDRVLEVDGVKTGGEAMGKTISRLKGTPDTQVRVKIFRRGWREPREVTITRAKISVDSVFHEMLPGRLGYVRLVRFAPRTREELKKALADLRAKGARGLVIDLRDNPGGYLLSAVQLADEFLPEGKSIVASRGRRVRSVEHKSTGRGEYADLPLTILINSGSASASEILAGALRDNKWAKLVGTKTYGKGSVQEPIRLTSEPGALLKLTVAKYYLPGGDCIHELGIAPDVEVVGEDEITPGWKFEEIAKVFNELEAWTLAAYKRQPEIFRALAEDDGGDATRYPGLAEKIEELKARAHISAEDVRPYVRRVARRMAADDRNRRFVSNMEDDRQLRRAALVLLERLGVAGELPAPYDRYARSFEEEARRGEAQAAGRLHLPQEGE